MKRENIGDAMEMLDDELLNDALEFRSRKCKARRAPKFAVAAAAVAVMVFGATTAAAVGGRFVDIKNIFGAVVGTQYVDATEEIKVEFLGFKNGEPDLDIKPVDPSKAPYNIGVMKLASYNITDENGNIVAQKTSDVKSNQSSYGTDDTVKKQPQVSISSETDNWSADENIASNPYDINYNKLTPTGEKSDMIIETFNIDENWEWHVVETKVQHYEGYIDPQTGEKFWRPTDYDILENGTYNINIESFVIESKADQPLEIHGDWTVEFTI